MNYCIKCGAKLLEGARFCANCGAEIPEKHEKTVEVTATEATAVKVPEPKAQPVNNTTATEVVNEPSEKSSDSKSSILRYIGIGAISALVIFFVVVVLIMAGGPSSSGNIKKRAKNMTKHEISDAWKEFDEGLELQNITYDSIREDEMSVAEIADYVADTGKLGLYDGATGKDYDTHWEYWEEINYDPYADTYLIITVRGDYHVTDNRKQDYKGSYCVTFIYTEGLNLWYATDTELEMPDELKQYLPD